MLNCFSAHAVSASHTACRVQLSRSHALQPIKTECQQECGLRVLLSEPARLVFEVHTYADQNNNLCLSQLQIMLLCSIQLCSQHVAVTHGHMCLTGCRSTLQEAGCDAHWSQKAWWRSQLAERLDASSGLVTCLSHLSCTACHQQQGDT